MAVHISKDKFDEYEGVRQSGLYNMFDPRAREMTNLTKEEWVTIMKEYDKLAEAWLDEKD